MRKNSAPIIAALVSLLLALAAPMACEGQPVETNAPAGADLWKDPSEPIAARMENLVGQLTLPEKVSQLSCECPAIPRLGIPAYSHRNECLHGRMTGERGDFATVFPQAIGMAATWDPPLIHAEADAISTEARAKSNDYAAHHNGNRAHRFGLSYYSPNINIFRDPRWGRGQETYGEDPFLTAQMAVAFIHGLQGDDPRYVKIVACAKHFAVHSGPEPLRHSFDPKPSERDLYETYLPAFEAAVRDGHVGSVMGAYTALYGVPDCASHFLLTDLLRNKWGFDGFVISDGGAIWDVWAQHKFAPTPAATAAATVKAGCDMCSGNVQPDAAVRRRSVDWTADTRGWLYGGEDYYILTNSVAEGLISEKEIDMAVGRELTARFRLGLFDSPEKIPWSKIGIDRNDTPEHRALALKVAEESIVLLKNDGLLPLNRLKLKHIAVIGPNADSAKMPLGNYSGTPSRSTTILNGIKEIAGDQIEVLYDKACPLALKNDGSNKVTAERLAQVMATTKSADVIIFVGGIDATLEAEQANTRQELFDGFYRGDRTRIELPQPQEDLLKELSATGRPIVFVNCSGSAIAMSWETKHLPAIVQAWYPGEEGGRAVAEVLFGEVNPAGRLPITFYRSTADLPPFEDYSMSNRTYRYFSGRPLFAFGHGLSYTKFSYKKLSLESAGIMQNSAVTVSFELKNTGARDGDEVAQIYFRHANSAVSQPNVALCGFTRVHLTKGESKRVTLNIPAERFRYWDTAQKQYFVEPGKYELLIGGASDDIRLRAPINVAVAP